MRQTANKVLRDKPDYQLIDKLSNEVLSTNKHRWILDNELALLNIKQGLKYNSVKRFKII